MALISLPTPQHSAEAICALHNTVCTPCGSTQHGAITQDGLVSDALDSKHRYAPLTRLYVPHQTLLCHMLVIVHIDMLP
jgi:hypothetical protein